MRMSQWSLCVSLQRLPVYRQQRLQVVLIGHAWQLCEQVIQVSERILAVALTGHDQRVEDGRMLAGIGMADEQPVLLPNAGRSDRIFKALF